MPSAGSAAARDWRRPCLPTPTQPNGGQIVHQNSTEMSGIRVGPSIADRLRDAVLLLILVIGLPLALGWIGFLGWSVLWLVGRIL
ncbi:hypothetical protein [Methylobacterium sp. ID0610]|uniref:hypothetical protein n=1 Tax=Methylobacterium carpenticola TaxID=3344827 RepID=UPI0036BD5892